MYVFQCFIFCRECGRKLRRRKRKNFLKKPKKQKRLELSNVGEIQLVYIVRKPSALIIGSCYVERGIGSLFMGASLTCIRVIITHTDKAKMHSQGIQGLP